MDSGKRTKREAAMRRTASLMRMMTGGMRMRLDDELRDRKVTSAQLRFLFELQRNPASTGAQLARLCHVTPQSAQTMMVRAVDRGWAIRKQHADNHRLMTALITPAGRRILERADAVFTRLEGEVWAGVRQSEFEVVNAILERGLARL